jgi:hypothetical protein
MGHSQETKPCADIGDAARPAGPNSKSNEWEWQAEYACRGTAGLPEAY